MISGDSDESEDDDIQTVQVHCDTSLGVLRGTRAIAGNCPKFG